MKIDLRNKFWGNLKKFYTIETFYRPFATQTKQINPKLHKIKFRRKLNTKIKLQTTLWQFPENLFIRKFSPVKGWKIF
jgi:hypothetical protein